MNNAKLFVIDYTLHGDAKSFIIRLDKLDAAEAWHWASCDAGVGRIGRFSREQVKKTSQAQAEKFGILTCNGAARTRAPRLDQGRSITMNLSGQINGKARIDYTQDTLFGPCPGMRSVR